MIFQVSFANTWKPHDRRKQVFKEVTFFDYKEHETQFFYTNSIEIYN